MPEGEHSVGPSRMGYAPATAAKGRDGGCSCDGTMLCCLANKMALGGYFHRSFGKGCVPTTHATEAPAV
jgi:hypothetical protein